MYVGNKNLQADTATYDMKQLLLMGRPIQNHENVGTARQQKFRLIHALRQTQCTDEGNVTYCLLFF
jgi:hypothetical protein